MIRQGVFVNLLNPKVSLVMLALMPQFVDESAGSMSTQLLSLGAIHVLLASAVLTTLAVAATAANRWLPRAAWSSRVRPAAGALLVLAGLKLALSPR